MSKIISSNSSSFSSFSISTISTLPLFLLLFLSGVRIADINSGFTFVACNVVDFSLLVVTNKLHKNKLLIVNNYSN